MKKHAYLIMSHNEFPMLRKLLEALDDARADIFLHIDSKTKDVPIEVLSGSVCYSDLIYVDRSNISWGGYSMVSATVNLLFTATQKNNYQYYHLLSGVDYPLKNNEEFFLFFDKNECEYISFDEDGSNQNRYLDRVKYYRFLSEKCGNSMKYLCRAGRAIDQYLILLQRFFGINRTKNTDIVGYKGDQWFSISDRLAKYIVSKRDSIEKSYRWTRIPDEMFVQNIALSSPYSSSVVNDSLRAIDWTRGTPYVFRESDYDYLITCGKLFARKFSYDNYPDIVNMIEEYRSKL